MIPLSSLCISTYLGSCLQVVVLDPDSHLLHGGLQTRRFQLDLVMQVGSEEWRSEEYSTVLIGSLIVSVRTASHVPEPSHVGGILSIFSKSGSVRLLNVAV